MPRGPSNITELDPAVLTVFLSFEETLRTVDSGARIIFENVSADLKAMLEATGLVRRFPLSG